MSNDALNEMQDLEDIEKAMARAVEEKKGEEEKARWAKKHLGVTLISFFRERVDATFKTDEVTTSLQLFVIGAVVQRDNTTPLHYGKKPGHFETSNTHFSTSEGVSEERGGREQSEQSGASE